jgi:hypothetical protein
VEEVYGLYVSSCPPILSVGVLIVRYVSSGGG